MTAGPVSAAEKVTQGLRTSGVLPIVILPEVEHAVPLVDALVAGGIRCVEVVFRTPAARDGVAAIRERHPDVLVGAGTILDASQLADAVEAGADYLVAPGTDPEIVRGALDRGVPIIPGVCTPSEIGIARGLGLRTVKFFPAEPIGGPRYLRAMCGPFPDVSFVPTGNITPASLPEYLAIPQVLAVGGTWMVSPELIAAGEFDQIQRLAAEAHSLCRQSR
ncbi:MAG TPA: bifunctional 4-hydroxy-2-oxoglutarate aldolase/2-dehydro-3-deoxy-phosphogluconate aldolase [Baekduia sp.]|nr:bifunctional 4-hydroxy-2-oxoglutarate aldolase/2-dehydro-3-deoxy-phosphogluconate aldolase [Baekduia sp.]